MLNSLSLNLLCCYGRINYAPYTGHWWGISIRMHLYAHLAHLFALYDLDNDKTLLRDMSVTTAGEMQRRVPLLSKSVGRSRHYFKVENGIIFKNYRLSIMLQACTIIKDNYSNKGSRNSVSVAHVLIFTSTFLERFLSSLRAPWISAFYISFWVIR